MIEFVWSEEPVPTGLEVRQVHGWLVDIALNDRETMERAYTELTPAAGELAGAGSGLLTLGPVSKHINDLATALRTPPPG